MGPVSKLDSECASDERAAATLAVVSSVAGAEQVSWGQDKPWEMLDRAGSLL